METTRISHLGQRVLCKAKSVVGKSRRKFRWLLARFAPNLTTEAEGQFAGDDGFAAKVIVHDFESRPRVSGTVRFLISVTHAGKTAWDPAHLPKLGLRWLTREPGQTEVVLCETFQMKLPFLQICERRLLQAEVPVPINSVLDVLVEFNLRNSAGAWLADSRGAARFPRRIFGQDALGAPESFDYEKLYLEQNLDQDYWTIVGPATRAEYEKLGQGNCDTLVQMGLTPASRVLDVGCGTGQLAEPLSRVLGPEGIYFGTDLAQPAIDFCSRRFPLPNFQFCKNGSDSLPIREREFDIIYLGSVFTHMYPADIDGMLGHLKRLLAPGGFVLVDAFVSPRIPGFIGSRAMIQLNENELQNRFRQHGFLFREERSLAWNDHCRRVAYRLTHGDLVSESKPAR